MENTKIQFATQEDVTETHELVRLLADDTDKNFADVRKQINNLREHTDKNFADVRKQMDRIEAKLDSLISIVQSLVEKVNQQDVTIRLLDKRLTNLEQKAAQ